MKLHILSFGKLNLTVREMTGQGGPEDIATYPSYGVLIEHEEGLILVDTGCAMDPAYPDRIDRKYLRYTDEDQKPYRLGQLGYKPEDVDYVLLTHMHLDHAGDFQLFSNATFITPRAEYEAALQDENPVIPRGLIEEWGNPDRIWRFIEPGEYDLVEGVKLIGFGPGHSYGMMGVLVDTKELGQLLIASDIVYSEDILNGLLPTNLVDREGFVSSVARVRELVDGGASIWYGHDIEQFATMRLAPDGYYE